MRRTSTSASASCNFFVIALSLRDGQAPSLLDRARGVRDVTRKPNDVGHDGACIVQTESAPSLQYLDRFGEQPLLFGRSSRRAAPALAVRTWPQPCLDCGPIDRAVLAQAVAALDCNHETDMPATTVTTYPQTVHPLEQFDLGFIEHSACPCPSDACQYFVRFSRPPQGVVDLSHAVVLGNEERTHPLYPFIAPAPRFNVIDGPRAMHPFRLRRGLGNAPARTSASSSLSESPVRSHTWCSSSTGAPGAFTPHPESGPPSAPRCR